jgi:hypothetical protein
MRLKNEIKQPFCMQQKDSDLSSSRKSQHGQEAFMTDLPLHLNPLRT